MSPKKKILIIDDEADLGLLLKDYFVRKDYDVTLTHTLGDGKALLDSYRPDILFLDNNLPDEEGWDYAPVIAGKYPDVYIVLISAYHPVIPAMPAGAKFRVIEKPIRRSDLDEQFSEF